MEIGFRDFAAICRAHYDVLTACVSGGGRFFVPAVDAARDEGNRRRQVGHWKESKSESERDTGEWTSDCSGRIMHWNLFDWRAVKLGRTGPTTATKRCRATFSFRFGGQRQGVVVLRKRNDEATVGAAFRRIGSERGRLARFFCTESFRGQMKGASLRGSDSHATE